HEARGAHDLAAVDLAERLMPETHAEHGHGAGELLDRRLADPGIAGFAGPRRDHEALGLLRGERLGRDRVVAVDLELGAERAQVLHEVVGEGIVVVEDRDHACPASARCSASHSARPLFIVSSHSNAGSESATMPAPTPQCAWPFLNTSVRMAI